ncbi:MAG: hypothetical protein WDO16_15590 [Bacteroidota bacterium]
MESSIACRIRSCCLSFAVKITYEGYFIRDRHSFFDRVFFFPAICGKTGAENIREIRFLGEYILPSGIQFKNTSVGGLSGIDYDPGRIYII